LVDFHCPGCGADVPAGRKYCRPSCRATHEHRSWAPKLPGLAAPLSLESELPSDDEMARARAQRERIRRLYDRRT
jgi:hypothetical protein